MGFLKWYKKNQKRLESIPLVKGGGVANHATFYSVDFQATERYLNELKKSGFLSSKYLNNLRQYFKNCNDSLKKYPQNDGPAYGFGFDLVLQAQDYEDIIENIDKAKTLSKNIERNTAMVKIGIPPHIELLYTLAKQGNTWLIDTYKLKF